MKFLFVFIFRLMFLQTSDTIVPNDTITISYYERLLFKSDNAIVVNGKHYIGNNLVSEMEYYTLLKSSEFKYNLIGLEDGKNRYCILYDKSNKKIEEGFWTLECFIGPYVSFHKNGKIKSKGNYLNPMRNNSSCVKIKSWIYCNKRGKIIRVENYDNEGNLISTEKPPR